MFQQKNKLVIILFWSICDFNLQCACEPPMLLHLVCNRSCIPHYTLLSFNLFILQDFVDLKYELQLIIIIIILLILCFSKKTS